MIVGANMPWQHIDTESGLIMPWYVLPCLEWLKKQDVSKWIVFEFGCGYSTIWFKLNALWVISVDNNEQWAEAMGAKFFPNQDEYVSYAKLCTSSLESIVAGTLRKPQDGSDANLFDCICIDGAWRLECLQNSFDRVRQGGYIIIDNWNGEDFPNTKEALQLLKDWECQIFKQPNHSVWQTAVFSKK